jgi:hypothetical protein
LSISTAIVPKTKKELTMMFLRLAIPPLSTKKWETPRFKKKKDAIFSCNLNMIASAVSNPHVYFFK